MSINCYYKWWEDRIGGGRGGWGGGWLIYNRVWERGQGVGIILKLFVFFVTCAFFLCSLMSYVPFF